MKMNKKKLYMTLMVVDFTFVQSFYYFLEDFVLPDQLKWDGKYTLSLFDTIASKHALIYV